MKPWGANFRDEWLPRFQAKMATISPHDAENAMSQPSGSLDAQSIKRNVGGCSQIVDPRSHKEGIRRHVLLHENRISGLLDRSKVPSSIGYFEDTWRLEELGINKQVSLYLVLA